MNVLVVKLSSLGDVLHAWPALMEARERVPGVTFDWCVDRPLAGLVRLLPGIRDVIANDAYGGLGELLVPGRWRALSRLGAHLKSRRYDLVIDAQGLLRSAVVARSAGATVHGFDRSSAREGHAALLLHRRAHIAEVQLASWRLRQLFGTALGYSPSMTWTAPLLPQAGAPGKSAFLLHGSSAASKRWPVERWIRLARTLSAEGYRLRTTWSSPEERQVADDLAAAVPGLVVLAHQPLEIIAQSVAASGLVVGGDTGLTHFADIAGRRTVMLFSGSDPLLTGPIGRLSRSVTGVPVRGRPRRREAARPAAIDRLASVDAVLAAIADVTEPVA